MAKVQIPTRHTQRTLRLSVSSSKYNQRTLNKVQISVSSSKYIQRTLSKVQTSVSSDASLTREQRMDSRTKRNPIPNTVKITDRSLTTVRRPLTDVRPLTPIPPHRPENNWVEVQNISMQILGPHRYQKNKHNEGLIVDKINPPSHTPYGPHNLPHMVLCTKRT